VRSLGTLAVAVLLLVTGCVAAPSSSGGEDSPGGSARGYDASSPCSDFVSESNSLRSTILGEVFPDAEPAVRDAVLEACRSSEGLTLGDALALAQEGADQEAAEAALWSGFTRTLSSVGTVPANQPYDGYTLAIELDLGSPRISTGAGTALDTTEITLRWEGTVTVRNTTPSREFPEVGVKTLYLLAAYPISNPACVDLGAVRVGDNCVLDVSAVSFVSGGHQGLVAPDQELSGEFGGPNAGGLLITVPDAELEATLEALQAPLALALTWTLETIEFDGVCPAPRIDGATWGDNLLLGTVPSGNEGLFC
jgi:hypothetical protein